MYEQSREEMTRPGPDWWSAVPYAWIAARLLARPAAANEMVRNTVSNYALSIEAAERIRDLPLEQLNACLNPDGSGS